MSSTNDRLPLSAISVARLRALLAMSTSLTTFHARICLSDDGDMAPDTVCSELMSLLPPSAIALVKVDLRPTSFKKCGYGVSRSRIIDAFVAASATPNGDVLKLQHPPALELSVFDEAVIHDSIWWSSTLSDRRLRRWGDIKVDVQRSCKQFTSATHRCINLDAPRRCPAVVASRIRSTKYRGES